MGCHIETHNQHCGCNTCFLEACHKTQNLNKETLLNTVRDFISNKETVTTDLNTHEEKCMCINHLIYYKENQTPIVDKILGKITLEETTKTETKDSKIAKQNGKDQIVKEKEISNPDYNKLRNK